MSKLIIESSDKTDSDADIELKLEKAVDSIRLQREKKTFTDPFLLDRKQKADKVVSALFDNMVSEISDVLSGTHSK